MDTIHIEKRTFPVLDMSCAACAARVDKTLNGQPGVRTASVNYAAATATVEYDTAQCSPEQLKAALQAAGYDLLVGDDRKQLEDRAEQAHDEKYRRLRQRTVWAIILALPVAVIDKDLSDRMASTIRHNRARGTHNIELMSEIVAELTRAQMSDQWIMRHIGMDRDELLRLKQITGLAALFADREFSLGDADEEAVGETAEALLQP